MTASNISKTRKLDRPTLLTGYAGRAVIIANPEQLHLNKIKSQLLENTNETANIHLTVK